MDVHTLPGGLTAETSSLQIIPLPSIQGGAGGGSLDACRIAMGDAQHSGIAGSAIADIQQAAVGGETLVLIDADELAVAQHVAGVAIGVDVRGVCSSDIIVARVTIEDAPSARCADEGVGAVGGICRGGLDGQGDAARTAIVQQQRYAGVTTAQG